MKPRRSGRPTLDAYRTAPPPARVPTADTAWAVWKLVQPRLMPVPEEGHERPRGIEDIASSVLTVKGATATERTEITVTALQALTVAIDVMVCAGRDDKPVYINDVFQALARGWSPLFRDTHGSTVWKKKRETLTSARTETLDAGVNLTKVWTACCDGIEGLYTVSQIPGFRHTRGRRVTLVEGGVLSEFDTIIHKDTDHRRPRPRNRILRADSRMPRREISKVTIGERDYDVMEIGEPTKQVLDILEEARVFVNVAEVRALVESLESEISKHPWPKMFEKWKQDNPLLKNATATQRQAYEGAKKRFISTNTALKREYASLRGRHAQDREVLRQADAVKDENGLLEIKTPYMKTRNRRFQPRRFWPSEVTSKKGVTSVEWPNDMMLWDSENGPFIAKASPRGLWFYVRPHYPDGHREWANLKTGQPWIDDFDGPLRPLIGVDVSSSMYQIVSVVLGWRDAELFLREHDLKPAIMAALRQVDQHGLLRTMTDAQARQAAGVVVNTGYGQSDMSILKKLRSDTATYGDGWRDVTRDNLTRLLGAAAKIDRSVALVLAMRDEYLSAAHALADAAERQSSLDGIRLLDPFDGQPYVLNRPITKQEELPNEATPLIAIVPVGDGPNWHGREIPTKNGKTRRVDTTGSIHTSLAPTMIHALDASYAAHVALKLREVGVRDMVLINDCFLVPSDAYPLLINALEEAAKSWFEGLAPFYETFEQYLGGDLRVSQWRKRWEARLTALHAGSKETDWPDFKFKDETTVIFGG